MLKIQLCNRELRQGGGKKGKARAVAGMTEPKTTQKASVAKMSLLIFITEPKSWGFSPIQ